MSPEVVVPVPARRARRAAIVWVVIAAVVVVVGAALVVADGVARGVAERQIAGQVEQRLPAGVTGEVTAKVGGASVFLQALAGRFDRVTLSAPHLLVQGAPLAVTVTARGVPLESSQPVDRVDAAVRIDQASMTSLIRSSDPLFAGEVELDTGVIGYQGTIPVFGRDIGYDLILRPKATGDAIVLTREQATMTSGGTSLDIGGLLDRVVGSGPADICVARLLPKGVKVDDIAIHPRVAVIGLHATGLVLDRQHLAEKGDCG